jgi:hypothetical protein
MAVVVDNLEHRNGRQASLEIRSFLQAWASHWGLHEYGEQVHVRTGWVFFSEETLGLGRNTRIARLSVDGVTDAVHERSWLDEEVATFINPTRFPAYCAAPMTATTAPATNGQANSRDSHSDSGFCEDVTMRPVNATAANAATTVPDEPPVNLITLGVERLNAS